MKKNKNQYKPIILIIFIGLLWVMFNEAGFIKWISLNHEHQNLINDIKQLTIEEHNVSEHITRLENDFKYIEFLAYSKFKMVKPGEKIFRIKDTKQVINK